MEEAVFGRGSVAEQTACWTVACWGSGRGLGLLLFLSLEGFIWMYSDHHIGGKKGAFMGIYREVRITTRTEDLLFIHVDVEVCR